MKIKGRATGITDLQQLIGADKFGSDAVCDILDADCGMSEESKVVLNNYLGVTQDMRETLEELSNTYPLELSNTFTQKENGKQGRTGAEIGSDIVQADASDDEPQGRWGVLVKVKGYKVLYSDAETQEEAITDIEERLDKYEDTRMILDSLKPTDVDWNILSANTVRKSIS